MKQLSIVLKDKDPMDVNSIVAKFFTKDASGPARFMHSLLIRLYPALLRVKLPDQKIQYYFNVTQSGSRLQYTESLVLYEHEDSGDWLINLTSTNVVNPEDFIKKFESEKSYDSDTTMLSLSTIFLKAEDVNICSPLHHKLMWEILTVATEGLKGSHLFNLYMVQGNNLILKAVSAKDDCVVSLKSRSWTASSLRQFDIPEIRADIEINQHFH